MRLPRVAKITPTSISILGWMFPRGSNPKILHHRTLRERPGWESDFEDLHLPNDCAAPFTPGLCPKQRRRQASQTD
jgi:hypothetical protein